MVIYRIMLMIYWQVVMEPSQQTPPSPEGAPIVQAASDATSQSAPDAVVSWQASEYIHHDKGAGWFIALLAVVLVACGISIWLQAWTFVALIIVMAIAVVVYAVRVPQAIEYTLGPDGLQINDKHYDFNEFKAFGVVPDGGIFSVVLVPTKRFMPALTIYFEEKDGEKIVDILGSHLPVEKLGHDFIERFTRRIHF